MQLKHAIEMLAPGVAGLQTPETWADIGCGNGLFTQALAHVLPPGSAIHAMDTDAPALRDIPRRIEQVDIRIWRGDFLATPWPFDALDGVLLANALHYVEDQAAFVRSCAAHMKPRHRFLLVEYDTETANPWVPYPLGQQALASLFAAAGYPSSRVLGARDSRYQSAGLYSAVVERDQEPAAATPAADG